MVKEEKGSASRMRSAKDWREQVFDIVEPLSKNSKMSRYYDWLMVVVTLLSFVPLMFHNESEPILMVINVFCILVFLVDYVARFITADFHYGDKSVRSFVRYPFSLLAIIDLVVILSLIAVVNSGFRLLRTVRLLHVVRIFQHSRSLQLMKIVLKRALRPLLFVASLDLIYIFMIAAIMFNEEPELFPSFLDSLYWAVITLTSVGYGDIVPTTELGRLIVSISSIMGIAVFALPTSVITAEYVAVVNEYREGKIDGKHHPRRFEIDETELIADTMKDLD